MALVEGQNLRVGSVFGGEKGDDVAEDTFGEAVHLVGEELFLFWPLLL